MTLSVMGNSLWVGKHTNEVGRGFLGKSWSPLELSPTVFYRADYGITLDSGVISRWTSAGPLTHYVENSTTSERPSQVTISNVLVVQTEKANNERLDESSGTFSFPSGNGTIWAVFRMRTTNDNGRSVVFQNTGVEMGSGSFGSRIEWGFAGAGANPAGDATNVLNGVMSTSNATGPEANNYQMASGSWSLINTDTSYTLPTSSYSVLFGNRSDGAWSSIPGDADIYEAGALRYPATSEQRSRMAEYMARRYGL
jgi:hypothetical protein